MLDKAAAKNAVNDDIGEATRLELYRSQVNLRESEQRAYDLFLQNLVKGTSHLSLGQEAVAAGFATAMKKGDLSFCTYRGHAHTLARGVPVEKVLGELMQRDNGLMRGKGGSMHLTSAEHGVLGSYAIIGAHLPIACGAALRAQYKGDGEVTAVEHPAADRAASYGLERIIVDGNDADAVYRAATAAYAKARAGGGPSLIEAMTYRYSGHSRADPAKYRPAGELEEWMKRDPIALYRARLVELGVAESTLREMEGAVQRAVDEATEAAKASPPSPVDVIDRDVWADGGSSW